MALDGNDCEETYSGNTHHKRSAVFEHMETDLRSRLDIAPGAFACLEHQFSRHWPLAKSAFDGRRVAADAEWREDQLPREWVPEKRPSMVKHMARVRDRLKR